MKLNDFNKLGSEEASRLLKTCCGCGQWVKLLMEKFLFADEMALIKHAEEIWYNTCSKEHWLEAFTHHPKIGDVKSLQEKFAATQHLAGNEQAGVNVATQEVIEKLAKANADYEAQFGFIFIVCATGKTAVEMLRLLQDRLKNTYEEELNIAMGEQHKITIIRLKKLLNEANWQGLKVSQITTHVLDTSVGKPGQNLTIRLKHYIDDSWQTFSQGVTNADGRIADLLPPSRNINPGNYKMVFETGNYFYENKVKGFYPEVEIQFAVLDDGHYHVPLLINPFGYSTYRGS